MRRSIARHDEAAGQDSFLDIVANIVGILIILVLVAGVRAKHAPVVEEPDRTARAAIEELQEEGDTERSIRADVLQTAEEIRKIDRLAQLQFAQRSQLSDAVSVWQERIASHRNQLDAAARENFDLRRSSAEARQRLDRLRSDRAAWEQSKPEPIVVESYPTPISKVVDGQEAHFQLRGGRITFVPVDRLIARFKSDAKQQAHKLLEQRELTDTVGPLGGFRLRYTLRRHDIPPGANRSGGSIVRLERWTLIPTSRQLGERLDDALSQGSTFRQALAAFRPDKTTVTIWTYPNSFAEFRRLKKELYEWGYSVAARPLPHGTPIAGSPDGSRSAAQ